MEEKNKYETLRLELIYWKEDIITESNGDKDDLEWDWLGV